MSYLTEPDEEQGAGMSTLTVPVVFSMMNVMGSFPNKPSKVMRSLFAGTATGESTVTNEGEAS